MPTTRGNEQRMNTRTNKRNTPTLKKSWGWGLH